MPTIRPTLSPPAPAVAPKPANAGRLAAQKAFFQIAAGDPAQAAAPPAQASATAAVTRAAPPATRSAEPAAEAPTKLLRPGSLLDIRV
jgi:hypothetical protein